MVDTVVDQLSISDESEINRTLQVQTLVLDLGPQRSFVSFVHRCRRGLLSQLATSENELASGLGQCLEALRFISALPRLAKYYIAHHQSVWLRTPLSRPSCRHQTVITLIKTSLPLSDPIHVTTALFSREDGTIDPTPVLVDEDLWKELTLHVEDDLERLSTASTLPPSLRMGPSSVRVTVGECEWKRSNGFFEHDFQLDW